MESFGKRIMCLAAFMVAASAIFPIWVPAQQSLQYQVGDNTRRIAELSTLPTKVAVMEQQLASIQQAQSEIKASVADINGKAWALIVTFMLWAASQIFGLFGGKFKRE